MLSRHWATGQSGLEDQHLGALLAWIDPPQDLTGAEAARRAELARDADGQLLCPPAGPATDPAFDNRLLAPAIERYDRARSALAAAEDPLQADTRLAALTRAEREIRDLVESRTRPTWDAVWRGLDLLRALPAGAHVEGALDPGPLVVHRAPGPGAGRRAPAAAPGRRGDGGEQAGHARAGSRPAWRRRRRWTIRW